jgi:uncharacterized protein (DUF2236 family)
MARILAPFEFWLDRFSLRMLQPAGAPVVDFAQPAGEPALVAPDSISWRIFRNPLALFIGGVSAVILELAEPAVRSGVWEHSDFRRNPVGRLQRTGLAAMVTVYGARSVAADMIAGVVRRHERVTGRTPSGEAYAGNDVMLLDWVQATATFGFAQAYHHFVAPLDRRQYSQVFAEGNAAALLYGATSAPRSAQAWEVLLNSKLGRLESSSIVFDFLDIVSNAAVLPSPLRPLQKGMVRAAVDITPQWVRERLGLGSSHGLAAWERKLLRQIGATADRLLLPSSPPVQSCLRLGLPADYLLRGRRH